MNIQSPVRWEVLMKSDFKPRLLAAQLPEQTVSSVIDCYSFPGISFKCHLSSFSSLAYLSPAKASVWNARSMGFVISIFTACVLVFGLLSHFKNRPSVEVPVQVVEVVPEKPLAA